jgi:hypothetical protein
MRRSRLSDILRFMGRVESRTGVVPVAYLENSAHLKLLLGSADAATKAKLRRMPYWLALYSHDSGAGDPRGLLNQYRVWSDWTLWQYGGVDWERGRSRPKVYITARIASRSTSAISIARWSAMFSTAPARRCRRSGSATA